MRQIGFVWLVSFLVTTCTMSEDTVGEAPVAGQVGARARARDAHQDAEAPGVSAALYARPFYSCSRNYYVSPTGADSADGSVSAPWRTIQRADAGGGGRIAGDCVNVEPGTYAAGTQITNGGNLAAPTGYVVYRCAGLDSCHITNPNYGFKIVSSGSGPNYVVFDGFDLAASSQAPYGQGIEVWDGLPGGETKRSSHHIWVLNSLIHGFGQSGVQMNDGEYFYVIHNNISNNSNVTCDAQGSGISFAVLKAFSISRTPMDNVYSPFNNVIEFNQVHNNILSKCGAAENPYDTDGNGIILDTFNNSGAGDILYASETLTAYNLTYSNGAKGIQVFRTDYATIANNTSFGNNLDPYNNGTFRPEISQSGGRHNTYINNIAIAVTGSGYASANSAFGGGSSAGVSDANNSWTGNISYGGSPTYGNNMGNSFFGGDIFSCVTNKCNVNPNIASASAANFALNARSPAIASGSAPTYLPVQATDAGACFHTLNNCP